VFLETTRVAIALLRLGGCIRGDFLVPVLLLLVALEDSTDQLRLADLELLRDDVRKCGLGGLGSSKANEGATLFKINYK